MGDSTMHRIETLWKLADVLSKNDHVYLYGAGHVGKLLLSVMKRMGVANKIRAFLVSNRKEETQLFHIKVIDIHSVVQEELANSVILLSVMEESHAEMADLLLKLQMGEVRFYGISNSLIYYMRYMDSLDFERCIVERLDRDLDIFEKKIPMQELAFSVHLCEHCNLNCAGCNNCSPLANEEYTDLPEFARDIERLGSLSDGEAYRIQLTGGEPLLNPRAIEYAIIARKHFPYARIAFLTNGILVKKQSEEFWSLCREHRIAMDFTPYPIGVNYLELGEFLVHKGLEWKYQIAEEPVKTMRKEGFVLNPNTPKSQATHNWLHCYMANNCMQLHHGKMSCTKLSNAHHFIRYFSPETRHMHISEKDFIDIYKVQSIDDIFNFFANPFPFCKYCNVDGMEYGIPWQKSKYEIKEWV